MRPARGEVEIREVDPERPDAQFCIRSYVEELNARSGGGFDPDASLPAEPHELRPPAGVLLLALRGEEPLGCGAVKLHGADPAELKRMWVAPSARGLGLGRQLLEELEAWAAVHGAPAARLETNRALREAIALYRSAGYAEVAPFNAEPFAHHWFEKPLR